MLTVTRGLEPQKIPYNLRCCATVVLIKLAYLFKSLDYGYSGGLRGDGLVLMSQLNLSHVRNLSG